MDAAAKGTVDGEHTVSEYYGVHVCWFGVNLNVLMCAELTYQGRVLLRTTVLLSG